MNTAFSQAVSLLPRKSLVVKNKDPVSSPDKRDYNIGFDLPDYRTDSSFRLLEVELFPEEIPPRLTIVYSVDGEVQETRVDTNKHYKSKSVNYHEGQLMEKAVIQADYWYKTLANPDVRIIIKYRDPVYSKYWKTQRFQQYGGGKIDFIHNPLRPKETFLDRIKMEKSQTITLFEI